MYNNNDAISKMSNHGIRRCTIELVWIYRVFRISLCSDYRNPIIYYIIIDVAVGVMVILWSSVYH